MEGTKDINSDDWFEGEDDNIDDVEPLDQVKAAIDNKSTKERKIDTPDYDSTYIPPPS